MTGTYLVDYFSYMGVVPGNSQVCAHVTLRGVQALIRGEDHQLGKATTLVAIFSAITYPNYCRDTALPHHGPAFSLGPAL